MKKPGELWRCSRLRQVKYLNNIVEQDHRKVKRLTGPAHGFGSTDSDGLRGDGDDQERAGSEHWWQRHQSPGRIHLRAVSLGRLRRHLNLSHISRRPAPNLATQPAGVREPQTGALKLLCSSRRTIGLSAPSRHWLCLNCIAETPP
jgi:hypothetical protein